MKIKSLSYSNQYEDQLEAARVVLRDKGRAALSNPHAMIGKTCGCRGCFCCAANQVLTEDWNKKTLPRFQETI